MKRLRVILGDQLSGKVSALAGADVESDLVLMAEVQGEATYVRHHKKKIAFIFAAMRHFSEALQAHGHKVRYVTYDDPDNSQSLVSEIKRALADGDFDEVVLTEPGEYRLLLAFEALASELNVPVTILPDDRFLCSRAEFSQWANGRSQLRMEYFYRDLRRRYQILMGPDGKPMGGQWNFDADNRKPPSPGLKGPKRLSHPPSDILKRVLELVETEFSDHFGRLRPFHYALTRPQAILELKHFIDQVLPHFGDHQDAMVSGEPYLFHSLISSYLNVGLLLPLEVCRLAEAAYHQGKAPLAAVEGFIRQILGWREYVRGLYWHHMPDYAQRNGLNAHRPLPDFYWSGQTKMACVAEAVAHTRDHAYSHHIQRLMVTGNFALLAGLSVQEVCDWYLAVYSDAFEWVELPNTLGMALYADGGLMGSKPYAASGAYIHRMSTFCKGCAYQVKDMLGEKACPFNALYWDFLARNEDQLKANPRMGMMYRTLNAMTPEKRQQISQKASSLFAALDRGDL